METAPHTISDTESGISIKETETSGRIEVVGLDIDEKQCCALQHLLGLWKYGLAEMRDGLEVITEKLPRLVRKP